MSDRVERVARAIADAIEAADENDPRAMEDVARAAIAAADGPNSMEVRDQMLCERYGPNRPRAQWDVT